MRTSLRASLRSIKMAASTERLARGATADDLAHRPTEGMSGPNPFVGLRPCDVLATAQQIGAQALRQPALLVEQEAALARDLIARAERRRELRAPQERQAFRRSRVARQRALSHDAAGLFRVARRARRLRRALRARPEEQGARAVRAVALHRRARRRPTRCSAIRRRSRRSSIRAARA